MLTLFIIIIAVGLSVVLALLSKEMGWNVGSLPLLKRDALMKDIAAVKSPLNEFKVEPFPAKPVALDLPQEPVFKSQPVELPQAKEVVVAPEEDKLKRLESLLSDKNREIASLNEQVVALKKQCEDFDKLKEILDSEIVSLREQNRNLRSGQSGSV